MTAFADRQLALQVKLAGSPSRGKKRNAVLAELRALVLEELRLECNVDAPPVIAEPIEEPQHPSRPDDLFDEEHPEPPPPADPYGGREPYWQK